MLLKYNNILSANIPNLPGIYKFTNKVNGKIYIGKSVNLKERLTRYRNYFKKDCPGVFYKSVKKHGWENFTLEVIELFPSRTHFISEYLLEREAFWISFYDSTDKEIGYNIISHGGNVFGFKHLKKSTKPNPFFGKKHSVETRERMSLARKGVARTEEEKQKLRDWYKNNDHYGQKAVLQIDPETNKVIKVWPSLSEAERSFGKRGGSLLSTSIKRNKTFCGYYWRLAQ